MKAKHTYSFRIDSELFDKCCQKYLESNNKLNKTDLIESALIQWVKLNDIQPTPAIEAFKSNSVISKAPAGIATVNCPRCPYNGPLDDNGKCPKCRLYLAC